MGRAPSLWLFAAALAASPAEAQDPGPAPNQGLVVRDGTLGEGPPSVVAPGVDPTGAYADYLITPELGEQRGSNLFHSFTAFGVGESETATFTGPDGIDHVISRVTGGDPSEIDGTLRSTIPGADVWLLNPSGVVFGEGAQLDVPGSFHASTGESLGFEGGFERFYADGRPSSVLSAAQPEAFGFLGENGAASISIPGDKTLTVQPGGTLAVTGGDVSLSHVTLTAPNGHVSLEAPGEVALTDSRVDVSGETPGSVSIRGGRLVMTEGSKVLAENASPVPAETATPGPGSISVAASASVLVDDSLISVDTSGAGNAGTIHVRSPEVTFQNGPGYFHDFNDPTDPRNQSRAVEVGATAVTAGSGADSGAGGRIEIEAETSLTLQKGVSVSAGSFGIYPLAATGDGGSIHIKAGSLQVLDRSNMTAGAFRSEGNAGRIEIDVDTLRLDGTPQEGTRREEGAVDYAFIDASTYFNVGQPERLVPGALGTIDIEAGVVEVLNQGRLESDCGSCAGKRNPGDPPNIWIKADRIVVAGAGVAVGTKGGTEGDAGAIEIAAASLELREGGSIQAHTNGTGNAGTVTIDADSVAMTGGVIQAFTDGPGNGGDITIDADSVRIASRGAITATTERRGNAGTIKVDSDSLVIETGGVITSSTKRRGGGGLIEINADHIRIAKGGLVETTSLGLSPDRDGNAGNVALVAEKWMEVAGTVASASQGSGDAGTVILRAPRILIDGGTIATSAQQADGGDVEIHAKELVHLDAGTIRADVEGGLGTTGGDIAIDPEIVILQNESQIVATATGGSGGRITIIADNYFAFPRSVVSADAGDPELSGTVEVNTPDVDLAGTLTELPASYLDAASLMKERCAARRSGERAGSFAVRGSDGIPAEPDGWLPATAASASSADLVAAAASRPGSGGSPLLAATYCR